MADDWSRLCPPGGPREVEKARAVVENLRAKLPEQRAQAEAAKAAIVTAEAADRERMAGELRAGREAKPDADGVARAREQAASAQRAFEALNLAVQTSEDELGNTIRECRGAWGKSAEQRVVKARQSAQGALEVFEGAIGELRDAEAGSRWLAANGGLDRGLRASPGGLGSLTGSRKFSANNDDLPLNIVLVALRETLAPPPPPEQRAAPEPVVQAG